MIWIDIFLLLVISYPSNKSWQIRFSIQFDICSPRFCEAAVRWCSSKKMFWKNSQNLQENTCAGVSFYKNSAIVLWLYKKRLKHTCFFWILQIFKNTFFNRTPTDSCLLCFYHSQSFLIFMYFTMWSKYRSSRLEVFYKKGVF